MKGGNMKKAILAFILTIGLLNPVPAEANLTKCKDGTYSSSTGRGTCSGHGGVVNDYDQVQIGAANTLLGRQAQIDYTGSLFALHWYKGRYTQTDLGNDNVELCFDEPYSKCSVMKTWNIPSKDYLFKKSRLAAKCKNKTKLTLNHNYYTCIKNKFVLTSNVLKGN
jgi:hypothetical protein